MGWVWSSRHFVILGFREKCKVALLIESKFDRFCFLDCYLDVAELNDLYGLLLKV